MSRSPLTSTRGHAFASSSSTLTGVGGGVGGGGAGVGAGLGTGVGGTGVGAGVGECVMQTTCTVTRRLLPLVSSYIHLPNTFGIVYGAAASLDAAIA